MSLTPLIAQAAGINILFPLHDALYVECAEDPATQVKEQLAGIMRKASADVLGVDLMRVDTEIHHPAKPWIEEKGKAMFEKLGRYLKAA